MDLGTILLEGCKILLHSSVTVIRIGISFADPCQFVDGIDVVAKTCVCRAHGCVINHLIQYLKPALCTMESWMFALGGS